MEEAVADVIGDGSCEVSKFIRMEYLRGMIASLIELYFLIKESSSVNDALIDWAQQFAIRPLKFTLLTITKWLTGHEDYENKTASLRRLGEAIVRMMEDFDHKFSSDYDPLSCALGHLSFPARTFDEDTLLDFKEEFDRIIISTPTCRLCQFRRDQLRHMKAKGIDLHSEKQRQKYKHIRGYIRQAEWMEKAISADEVEPGCHWCKMLGDTIIALHSPQEAVLVAVDRAFIPLTTLLGKKGLLIPSLAQLKKQLT